MSSANNLLPLRDSQIVLKHSLSSQENNNEDFLSIFNKIKAHLNKSHLLSRKELIKLQEKMDRTSSNDVKNRWMIMKIKGLLSYIRKKRGDFAEKILSGDVTIFENSPSLLVNLNPYSHQVKRNLDISDDEELKSSLLTNNNFVTMDETINEADETLSNLLEPEEKFYSEDMFADGQTQNDSVKEHNNGIFKIPSIIPSATSSSLNKTNTQQSSSSTPLALLTVKEPSPPVFQINENYFDEGYENISQEIEEAHNLLESTLSQICEKITNLSQEDEQQQAIGKAESLKSHCSEENFLILKEACEKYRSNFKKHPSFQVLDENVVFSKLGRG